MSFLLGFIGTILGVLVAVSIVVICIMVGVSKIVGTNNIRTLISAAKNSKNIQQQEATRIKNVSGMTKLLEPEIKRDFPDFDKNVLFNLLENNLIKIFSAIENKDSSAIKSDKNFVLIFPIVDEYIKDLKQRNVEVQYHDVVFHEHAIKNYERTKGYATITTSTTLEYYYKNSEQSYDYSNIKRQTRYTNQFVYIYDETKLKREQEIFAIHCPNCGAPLRKVGIGECEYCNSNFEPINLKVWKMSSYKEDYK